MPSPSEADRVAEHERATWNRCASIYEATLVPFTQLGYELIVATGLIDSGTRTLDIGCGPGVFTARSARAGATVVGIDFSEEMIRIAQEQYPEVEFRVTDAEQLPFPDSTFDLVTGVHVVHHLARPRTVFGSLHRLMKPSAKFAFTIPDQLRQASFGSFFSAVVEHHKMDAMPGGPLLMETDPKVIRDEVLAGGFRECHVERQHVTCCLQSLAPLLEAGWKFASLDQVSEDVGNRIRATTLSNAEPYKQPDGSYEFPDEIFLGIATK